MQRAFSKIIALIGVASFILAFFVLRRELATVEMIEVQRALANTSNSQLVIAFLLTVLTFLCLTGYDLLGFRSAECKLPLSRVMLTAFVSHTISINVGFAAITGHTTRFRLYERKGLRTSEILAIVSFCVLMFWTGFLALGGIVFTLLLPDLPPDTPVSLSLLHIIGMIFLALTFVFLGFSMWMGGKTFRFLGTHMQLPRFRISLLQIGLASSEWILGSAILWTLLPQTSDVPYVFVLGIFLIAQVCGLLSQVPAGLGVFETIVIGALSTKIDPSIVLGCILLYRLLYHMLPLVTALLLLLIMEIRHQRRKMEPEITC